jgi:hypothetical protein
LLGFFVGVDPTTLPTAPILIVNKMLFMFPAIGRYFKQAMCVVPKSANKQTIHWTRDLFGAKFCVVHTRTDPHFAQIRNVNK